MGTSTKRPARVRIHQVGMMLGIERVKNWRRREAMAKRGVLTRPVDNVIVLMPPYCTTNAQVQKMVAALAEGVKSLR